MITISKKENNLNSENIVVLIGGWGCKEYMYFLIKKKIPKNYGYIHYSYSDEMLNSDPESTRSNFLKFIQIMIKDLEVLNKNQNKKIYLYGQSLGGLFCMIISTKITVNKIMLVTTGYNLAQDFWLGDGPRALRDQMVLKTNITLPELKEVWKEISPDFYLEQKNKLNNPDYFIILSKNDKTIPTPSGIEVINYLERNTINFRLLWVNYSHKITLVKEMILLGNFKKWLEHN